MDRVSSGCLTLDLKLGGSEQEGYGWPLGRTSHIVGDSSTGKTHFCIEAITNLLKRYGGEVTVKKGKEEITIKRILYCDAEATFDVNHAERLGMDVDEVEFVQPSDPNIGITFEDFATATEKWLDSLPEDTEAMCVLDSLDALPTEYEATTSFEERERGYGTAKTKLLKEYFRTTTQRLNFKKVAILVVTQTIDNIGVMFGPKKTFAGGSSVKFFASVRCWLKKTGELAKTINGKKLSYGVTIKADIEKNKCGPPFGEADFDLIWSYGIDDITTSLNYLEERSKLKLLPVELIGASPEEGEKKKGKKSKEEKEEAKKERDQKVSKISETLRNMTDRKLFKKCIQDISQLVIETDREEQVLLQSTLPQNKYGDDDE